MYLLRIEIIEVVLDKLDSGREVRLVKLVRYVPADRSELASLLHGGMKERDGVEQRLPLRHRHHIDQILTDDTVRSLQSGLDSLWRFCRVFDRRLYNTTHIIAQNNDTAMLTQLCSRILTPVNAAR